MVSYHDLLAGKYVQKIEDYEKESYVSFHFVNYKGDLESTNQLIQLKNAKYAVIAGYYAVLNVTLWYFAKYFNLKISSEEVGVHKNCLIVLNHFVKEKQLKERIIPLLEEAQKEFRSFTTLKANKEDTLPLMLRQSSEKRKKYTYYSSDKDQPKETEQINEANHFIETIVKPYIHILEALKC